MPIRSLALLALAALGCAPLCAAQADVERATVTGTVSALNPEKRSFTLAEDGSGKTEPYRAFYAGGHAEEIAAIIAKLTVGEHLQVVYTVREGRRALEITEVAK